MENLDALFDSIGDALDSPYEHYFNQYCFTDPIQYDGQRCWEEFLSVLQHADLQRNNILRKMAALFEPHTASLKDVDINMPLERRMDILKQRRIVMADCKVTIDSIRSALRLLLNNDGRDSYQSEDSVDFADFTTEHIPSLSLLESITHENAMDAARFERLLLQMKDEKEQLETYGLPLELHAQLAVHVRKNSKVFGYIFAKTKSQQYEEITYPHPRGAYKKHAIVTEIMTAGAHTEYAEKCAPTLLGNLLDDMAKKGSARLEWRIDEYHPKA